MHVVACSACGGVGRLLRWDVDAEVACGAFGDVRSISWRAVAVWSRIALSGVLLMGVCAIDPNGVPYHRVSGCLV